MSSSVAMSKSLEMSTNAEDGKPGERKRKQGSGGKKNHDGSNV